MPHASRVCSLTSFESTESEACLSPSRPHVTIPHVRGIRLAAPNDLQSRRSTRVRRRLAAPTRGHDSGCRSRTRAPWRTPLLLMSRTSPTAVVRRAHSSDSAESACGQVSSVRGTSPSDCCRTAPHSAATQPRRSSRCKRDRSTPAGSAASLSTPGGGARRSPRCMGWSDNTLRMSRSRVPCGSSETFGGHRSTLYASTGGRLYTGLL